MTLDVCGAAMKQKPLPVQQLSMYTKVHRQP